MKIIFVNCLVAIALTSCDYAYADNCYVLDGFPADQARCVQQAQQQQNIQANTQQQFNHDEEVNANAMNNAILLEQLHAMAQKNQPIDPNSLPQTVPNN